MGWNISIRQILRKLPNFHQRSILSKRRLKRNLKGHWIIFYVKQTCFALMNECSCSCFWYWAKITSIYMDSPGLLRINSTRHILRITMFLLAFFSFLNHSFIHSNKSSCLYHLRLLLGTKILTCITMSFLVFFFSF